MIYKAKCGTCHKMSPYSDIRGYAVNWSEQHSVETGHAYIEIIEEK